MAKNSLQQREKKSNSLQKQENKPEVQTIPVPAPSPQSTLYTPRVDIVETSDELIICADVPGVKPDDMEVRFENGELILHGRCAAPAERRNWLVAEYGSGDYYRAFSIGQEIDADRIAAELRQGVLMVHLPKSEAAKPKKIAVQNG
jgi:HSP20 family protein